MNYFRPMISRVVAAWVAALALYLSSKFGITLDDNAQEQIIAGGIAVAFALAQTVYALVHRSLDKRLNPGDAASSHLAASEQKETAQLKAADAAGERTAR